MMNVLSMNRAEKSDYKYIKGVYGEAFPRAERAPFRSLTSRSEQEKADLLKLMDGEEAVGFTYVIADDKAAYIMYLAIAGDKRGHGYGTGAIRALLSRYEGRKLFLALESLDETADNYEQRLSRHSFYEHAGLHDIPYGIKEFAITYSAMGNCEIVEPEEYARLIDRWAGRFWRRIIDMRMIR